MNARSAMFLVTGVLVVVAVALRVPLLSATDLWLDEACTVIDAMIPLSDIPSLLPHDGLPPQRYVASHPPLYYVIVTAAFGVFGASGWIARFVSLLFAIGLVVVATRYPPPGIDKRAAAFAGAVIAVHPLALYYGVEAKMYAMQWLLTALIVAGLARRAYVVAAIAQAALLYTHNFGLLLAPCWLAVLVLARNDRAELKRAFVAGLASVVVWLPWAVLTLPAQLGVQSGASNFKALLLKDTGHFERLFDSARALTGAPPFPSWLRTLAWVDGAPFTWLAWLLLPLAIVGFVLALRGTNAEQRRSAIVVGVALASTWLVLWVVDFRAPLFFPGRYETPALVALVWLAALAVRGKATMALAALAFVGLLVGGVSYARQPPSYRFTGLWQDVLASGARADDVIVAGLAWAPLQVAALDALPARTSDGSPSVVRAFPDALRSSAGELSTIVQDEAGVRAEAERIAADTAIAHTSLVIIAAPPDVALAQKLVDALEPRGCRASSRATMRDHEVIRFACP